MKTHIHIHRRSFIQRLIHTQEFRVSGVRLEGVELAPVSAHNLQITVNCSASTDRQDSGLCESFEEKAESMPKFLFYDAFVVIVVCISWSSVR